VSDFGFGLDIGVHNFQFRIWIGCGLHEKVSDWIRMIAKVPYPHQRWSLSGLPVGYPAG